MALKGTRYGDGLYWGPLPAAEAEAMVTGLLDRAFAGEGKVLHQARNRIVALEAPTAAGPELAVKIFPPPRGAAALRYSLRGSKAERGFRNALRLAGAGVGTPRPVAFLDDRRGRAGGRSVLITACLEGVEQLRTVLRRGPGPLPSGATPEFAEALGRYVASLHAAGVVHRDLSDGNILVSFDGVRPVFNLIDLNRSVVRRRVGPLAGIRDIIRVGVAPPFRGNFLRGYFGREPAGWERRWYSLAKRRFEAWLALKRRLKAVGTRLLGRPG